MSLYLLENYIKSVLKDNLNFELHVYDFDHTLYDPDSESWNENIVNSLEKSLKDKKTITILCTARPKNKDLINKTNELLRKKEISLKNFNRYYFMTNDFSSVPEYKFNCIQSEINKNNKINKVIFWDDREDTLFYVKNNISDDIIFIDNLIN